MFKTLFGIYYANDGFLLYFKYKNLKKGKSLHIYVQCNAELKWSTANLDIINVILGWFVGLLFCF